MAWPSLASLNNFLSRLENGLGTHRQIYTKKDIPFKIEVKPKLKILWKIWYQVGKTCIEFVEDELKIFSNIF